MRMLKQLGATGWSGLLAAAETQGGYSELPFVTFENTWHDLPAPTPTPCPPACPSVPTGS